MVSQVVTLRADGRLKLPAALRGRYGLLEGDSLTLIDADGVLLLVPRGSVVDKVGRDVERLADEAGLSEDHLVSGVHEERNRYAERRARGSRRR